MYEFKLGDTYPYVGRIVVQEEIDGVVVDTTALQDFSLWNFSCQYRDGESPSANLIYEVPDVLVNGGPVIDGSLPSSISAALVAKRPYFMDLRIEDENGVVRSTDTRKIVFRSPISVTP